MSAVKIAGIAVKTATIKELAHERLAILSEVCTSAIISGVDLLHDEMCIYVLEC